MDFSTINGSQAVYYVLLFILVLTILALLSFVLKHIFFYLLRLVGLYHFKYYSKWPTLPWRPLWRIVSKLHQWWQEIFAFGKRSTGGFQNILSTLCMVYKSGHIPLGRATFLELPLITPIGLKTKRHLMCFGMTGGGKTVFLTLLVNAWPSSFFLIDPIGKVTSRLISRSKKEWHALAPYDEQLGNATWNVFDEITEFAKRFGESSVVALIEKISEALIVRNKHDHNPFFAIAATSIVCAVIMHVYTAYEKSHRNLVTVYRLLTNGTLGTPTEDSFDNFLKELLSNPSFDGAIASKAASIIDAGKTTRGNILATARDQLKWIAIPEVQKLVRSSSFLSFELIERDDIGVSFIAPVSDIRGHFGGLLRLLTNVMSYNFERTAKPRRYPCLIACDEMQAQGYNEYVEQTAPVMRNYGVQFIGFNQDIGGFKSAYPQTWESFIGNADAVIWAATDHEETKQYLSNKLGKTSSKKNSSASRHTGNDRDVLTPEQINRLLDTSKTNQHIIVTRAGKRPIKLKFFAYFKELPVSIYDPDPEHRQPLLFRVTRWLLTRLKGSVSQQ